MRSLRLLAPFAALVASLALTAPVLAGGVAVVIPDDTGGAGVTAGDETTIGFELLQHGVSPVDFGVTTVVVTDLASGESFRIEATPGGGKTGHFEAPFVYPRGGWWTWHVEHQDLLVQSQPTVVGIFGAQGEPPSFSPREGAGTPAELVAQQLAQAKADNVALTAKVAELSASGAASAERVAATEGRPPLAVTIIGIVAAALAGLGLGFGTSVLAKRSTRPSPVREIAVALPADAD
jgi:hypothetical protein